MADASTQSEESFEDDPDLTPLQMARRRQRRWKLELDAAEKEMRQFRKDGLEAEARFRDERSSVETEYNVTDSQLRRLNVFPSDIQVKRDELLGNIPKVSVDRRYGDTRDQVARVAGIILERALNFDIERDERVFTDTMEAVLLDAMVPGLGIAMSRYVAPSGDDPEDVETLYLHWKDCRWSPCRRWEDRRWFAFGCEMSRQDLLDNFSLSVGEVLLAEEMEAPAEGLEDDHPDVQAWNDLALERGREFLKRRVPLNAQRGMGQTAGGSDAEDKDKKNYPWDRAYVWEIWDFDRRQVTRMVEGCDMVLQCIEDPLELKSFLPLCKPIMTNVTNGKCVPVSDWRLARGLYEEVDTLTSRISALTRACRLAGAYDGSVEALGRIFDEAEENRVIPVDSWAMFKEKGGIAGHFELVPLADIINCLDKLTAKRQETLDLLRQVTGISDLQRGQQTENGTPGEAAIKYRASSVRMQAWQKRIAQFASDTQAIRGEIMVRCCSTETILQRANAQYLLDAPDPRFPEQAQAQQQLLEQAVELLRSRFHDYRIQVRPESIAAEDFGQKTQERTELLKGMSDLLSKAQSMPPAMLPEFVEICEFAFAGIKGGKELEGTFQRMVEKAQQVAAQAQAQPPHNPEALKLAATQAQAQAKLKEISAKAQVDAAHQTQELKNDLIKDQAEAQQHEREEAAAHATSMQEDQRRAQLDVEKKKAELELERAYRPPQPATPITPRRLP